MKINILKFGGTSMGTADSITKCIEIIQKEIPKRKAVVVVSALGGVTDELLALIELAKKNKAKAIKLAFRKLEERHKKTLSAFTGEKNLELFWSQSFSILFKELWHILRGISLVGDISDKTKAVVASYGERFSSWMMHYALLQHNITSQRISATKLIRTNSNYLDAEVDFVKTAIKTKKLLLKLLENNQVLVITGFIASDQHGDITLLGRGGSDYTASILGLSLGAEAIETWTDVDGVKSADPRIIPDAITWPELDASVMAEMAYVGAKVLHPKTISPAIQGKIPVYIKNTFNPAAPGTKITEKKQKGLRGIVIKKKQALIQLANPAILNQIGALNQYSAIFAKYNIALDVCATSEISVTFSLNQKDLNKDLIKNLKKAAKLEIYENMAKVCVVGNHIGNDAEILTQIFSSLKDYSIYTVSNGASFNNITLIVEEKYSDEILKILHKKLFAKKS